VSAKFKDIPADVWEKEFFADELQEARKVDKDARVKVSGYSEAFNALMDVSGISPDVYQPLNIFLGKTKGKAPEEAVKFSEKEAGRLLPGEMGVASGSFTRRWIRAWRAIELEMARTGKQLGKRVKGSIKLRSRSAPEKRVSPTYYSEIAQAIVDIERAAAGMRGVKHDERFRRAALAVWNELPAYVAPEEKPKLKQAATSEPSDSPRAGNNTRRMKRWQQAAREMMEAAKSEGGNAPEQMAALLVVEFGRLVAASLDVESESAFLLLAEALESAAENEPVNITEEAFLVNTEWTSKDGNGVTKSDAHTPDSDVEICSENRTFDSADVDSPVHVELERQPAHRCPSPDVDPVEIDERVALLCEANGIAFVAGEDGFDDDAERRAEVVKQARRDLCEVCREAQPVTVIENNSVEWGCPSDFDPDELNAQCVELAESPGISQRKAARMVIAEHKAAFGDQTVRDGGST
jgi:hypothetical protein